MKPANLSNSPPRFAAPVAVAIVAGTLIYFGSTVLGVATMVIIGGSAAVAYCVWLATAWRRPIDPNLVTVPYLALVAMELLHMAEEQLTDFPASLGRIFQIPHTFSLLSHAVLLMGFINVIALLAALGIRSSKPLIRQVSGFFIWFYVIGPGMVNAIAHITFPFMAHTWYFSGLITVILPTAAGVVTLVRLLESDRNARAHVNPGSIASPAIAKSEENLAMMHAYFDALFTKDLHIILDMIDENIEWLIVPTGDTLRGKAQIAKLAPNHWAASPNRVKTLVNLFANDEHAALEYRTSGTLTSNADFPSMTFEATGQKYDFLCCFIFHISNGKIDRVREYFDIQTIERQLGMSAVRKTPDS